MKVLAVEAYYVSCARSIKADILTLLAEAGQECTGEFGEKLNNSILLLLPTFGAGGTNRYLACMKRFPSKSRASRSIRL